MAQAKRNGNIKSSNRVRGRWTFLIAIILVFVVATGVWYVGWGNASKTEEAPEAQKVLDVQEGMPFQILIPAYLPKSFKRGEMEIDVNMTGPGGEEMVQLTYETRKGETLFIREWVPVNPEKEVLAASRPIETKWGQGWLLRQGEGLAAIWVDIGPLRASIYTPRQVEITMETLLAIAENMGPASNRQVFDFILEPPELRSVEPPPPVEIPINDQGIQEVDLIVTPGGYSPLRFSVKKDVPVVLTFRQLGRVGCGNELNLPYGTNLSAGLRLSDETDKQVFEFTPNEAGEFTFFCAHLMYKGIMTVRE
jgi:hypothetical protein